MSFDWLSDRIKSPDTTLLEQARQRQQQLTKPPGSLGQLEDLACRLSAMQGRPRPRLEKIQISVFAADHGVVEEGVSAFPQSVTVEMLRNFSAGGAAISVLAQELGANLEVINCGTVTDPGEMLGVINKRICAGSANMCKSSALSSNQLVEALLLGRELVEIYTVRGIDLFIAGEMGIGNTTSAAAIACALLNKPAAVLTGPGTGLDEDGVRHKTRIIERALQLHNLPVDNPKQILQCLGGFEIAAMTGAYIAAAQAGIPILVDGFISSVAALLATRLQPDCHKWMILAHVSAEPGHVYIVDALQLQPLLNLGMRLGEGSGAAMAVPLLRNSCALHNRMATFAEAHVSDQI
ncbi:MAG: nicotinate-nucleotide--dimethylbenzimidazole phosphoribosyltransferase [Thiohalomonadales bacterium]